MAAQEGAAGTTNHAARVRFGAVDDSNFALRGRAVPLLASLRPPRRLRRRLPLPPLVVRPAPRPPRPRGLVLVRGGLARAGPRRRRHQWAACHALQPARLLAGALHCRQKGGDGGEEERRRQEGGGGRGVLDMHHALVAGEKVSAPSCGHCFHPECVDAWLRSQQLPLCRTLLLPAAAVASGRNPDVMRARARRQRAYSIARQLTQA
ncbi:hypothetical protein ZWY2020_005661 [Hordeum vulgare]|nr:hypothetical protein ZWY2020_005661 [Hordeum vulgare]